MRARPEKIVNCQNQTIGTALKHQRRFSAKMKEKDKVLQEKEQYTKEIEDAKTKLEQAKTKLEQEKQVIEQEKQERDRQIAELMEKLKASEMERERYGTQIAE